MDLRRPLTLNFAVEIAWLPMAQSLVETATPVMGLSRSKALKLSQACEEILAHLFQTMPGKPITLTLTRKGAGVLAELSLTDLQHLDLWAMNLTARDRISLENDPDTEQLGLLLASRLTDRFLIDTRMGQVKISLFQDLAYPELQAGSMLPLILKPPVTTGICHDPDRLGQACTRVMAFYAPELFPGVLTTPGRLADLVADGEWTVALAQDHTHAPAGMICWESRDNLCPAFYGPYLFTEASEPVARLLVEEMIRNLARTPAMALFSTLATPALPGGDFEILARTRYRLSNGRTQERPVWFRHLREDTGCRVWSHEQTRQFLEKSYTDLFLARTIDTTMPSGSTRPEHSMFSTRLDTGKGQAIILPMLDGRDTGENIRQHTTYLLKEGFLNLFFHLDLSHGWQAALAPDLAKNGFSPAYVLPFGGESDLLVFCYDHD